MQLQILALRHQVTVVHCSRRPQLRLTPTDRMLWAGSREPGAAGRRRTGQPGVPAERPGHPECESKIFAE